MIDDFFDGKVPGKNPKKMIKEMKAKGLISDDGGDDSQNEYGDETDIMLGSDASSFGEPELEVYYEKDENGNTVEKKRYVKKPKTIKRNKDAKPAVFNSSKKTSILLKKVRKFKLNPGVFKFDFLIVEVSQNNF